MLQQKDFGKDMLFCVLGAWQVCIT